MAKSDLATLERALEAALEKLSTERKRAFVREYPIDLNLTKAAERAGYSAKSARQEGSRLLTNAAIQDAIALALEVRAARTEITQDRVLNELGKIAFSNMRKFAEWGPSGVELVDSETLSDEDAACVSEVSESVTEAGGSKRIKLHDKKGALELLGRHLKMWGADQVNLNVLQQMSDAELNERIAAYIRRPEPKPPQPPKANEPPQTQPKGGTSSPPRGAGPPKKA